MINTIIFDEILKKFKNEFIGKHWDDEKYKWEAVKCFQDSWDINAPDFLNMFMKATEKTGNLLASINNFPRRMIKAFAENDQEFTRSMFINLFDESKGLLSRIEKFISDSEKIRAKYDSGGWKSHYQSVNAISTYLWLRFPDKYYIYKYSECCAVVKELKVDSIAIKGKTTEKLLNCFKLYDKINDLLKQDNEMKDILKNCISTNCYPDNEMKTLTIDICYYISNSLNTSKEITKDQWKKFILEIEKPNHPVPMQMLKAIMEVGGETTFKKLSDTYGGTPQGYVSSAMCLGKRAKNYFNVLDDYENKFFKIPFVVKYDENDNENNIYMIKKELLDALNEIDLSDIPSDYIDKKEEKYWWLNANPKIWSFSNISVGESQKYTIYNENGNKRKVFQNFLDAKAGDIVICYESNPIKKIVGIAQIISENDGEVIEFEKIETLVSPIDYSLIKDCEELENMEFLKNPNGSLFKLTKEEYDYIIDLIRDENPINEKYKLEKYIKQDFLSEVYMTEEKYESLVHLLKNKKNIILQGAPGVGKTFTAKRLAYSIIGEKDESKVEFVQFHQSYSYEDFIMGYKPAGETFELKDGIFYRFCQKASNMPDKDFFFIIDEINRGNLSKIFGELLMLIEKDYRSVKATLAYNGIPFSVPKNLFIIGMMNTADRSLAMIDYALRRRFSFFEVEPGFNSEGFKAYQKKLGNDTFDNLISRIEELNKEITNDDSLGKGFCIGHSYFCGQEICTDEWMREVIEYDIIPMLNEYWFDDKNKVQQWENNLRGIFND